MVVYVSNSNHHNIEMSLSAKIRNLGSAQTLVPRNLFVISLQNEKCFVCFHQDLQQDEGSDKCTQSN